MADIYPGQATFDESSLQSQYGMYRRTGCECGGKKCALHLLPLDGPYLDKLTEDGEPLFRLTRAKPRRDDVVLHYRNDVQHADRVKR